MENKKYIVYMHICPNDKKYIGITKQKPEYRWVNGKGYKTNIYFYRAINKYGWENINHKILYENLVKEEAEQKEIELIKHYKTNKRKYGYNIENGGHANCVSEETKKKISNTMKKNCKNNPNIFKKGQLPWITGKHHTKETIKIIKDKRKKQIMKTKKVICIETNEIFNSAREIEEKFGFSANNIRQVCEGLKKTHMGYHWKYIKEE